MGRREVAIYTCDGCGEKATTSRSEDPTGFRKIRLVTREPRDFWLCGVCYGAVEWVARFQRLTVPPKVYRSGRQYSLRKEEER